jgi:hypothetical protein
VGRYGDGGWHSTARRAPDGGTALRTCTREGGVGMDPVAPKRKNRERQCSQEDATSAKAAGGGSARRRHDRKRWCSVMALARTATPGDSWRRLRSTRHGDEVGVAREQCGGDGVVKTDGPVARPMLLLLWTYDQVVCRMLTMGTIAWTWHQQQESTLVQTAWTAGMRVAILPSCAGHFSHSQLSVVSPLKPATSIYSI